MPAKLLLGDFDGQRVKQPGADQQDGYGYKTRPGQMRADQSQHEYHHQGHRQQKPDDEFAALGMLIRFHNGLHWSVVDSLAQASLEATNRVNPQSAQTTTSNVA